MLAPTNTRTLASLREGGGICEANDGRSLRDIVGFASLYIGTTLLGCHGRTQFAPTTHDEAKIEICRARCLDAPFLAPSDEGAPAVGG